MVNFYNKEKGVYKFDEFMGLVFAPNHRNCYSQLYFPEVLEILRLAQKVENRENID